MEIGPKERAQLKNYWKKMCATWHFGYTITVYEA